MALSTDSAKKAETPAKPVTEEAPAHDRVVGYSYKADGSVDGIDPELIGEAASSDKG